MKHRVYCSIPRISAFYLAALCQRFPVSENMVLYGDLYRYCTSRQRPDILKAVL